MKNFYRKTRHINYGTKSRHAAEEYGPLLCKKCDVMAEVTNTEDRASRQCTDRGNIYYNWKVISHKCPECGTNEESSTTAHESCDGDNVATRHMGYGT